MESCPCASAIWLGKCTSPVGWQQVSASLQCRESFSPRLWILNVFSSPAPQSLHCTPVYQNPVTARGWDDPPKPPSGLKVFNKAEDTSTFLGGTTIPGPLKSAIIMQVFINFDWLLDFLLFVHSVIFLFPL